MYNYDGYYYFWSSASITGIIYIYAQPLLLLSALRPNLLTISTNFEEGRIRLFTSCHLIDVRERFGMDEFVLKCPWRGRKVKE